MPTIFKIDSSMECFTEGLDTRGQNVVNFTEDLNTRRQNRPKTYGRWVPYVRNRFRHCSPLTSTKDTSWAAEGGPVARKIEHVCDLLRAVSVTKLNDVKASSRITETDGFSPIYSVFPFNAEVGQWEHFYIPECAIHPDAKPQLQISESAAEPAVKTNHNYGGRTKNSASNPLQPKNTLNQKQNLENPKHRPDKLILANKEIPYKYNPISRQCLLSPTSPSLGIKLTTSNTSISININSVPQSEKYVISKAVSSSEITVPKLLEDATEEMHTQDGLPLSQCETFCKNITETNQNCDVNSKNNSAYNFFNPKKLLNQQEVVENPISDHYPHHKDVIVLDKDKDIPEQKNPIFSWWRFQTSKPRTLQSPSLDTNLSTANCDVNSFPRSDNCVFTSVAGLLGMTVQQLLDTTEEMQTQDGLSLSQLTRFCKDAGVTIMYVVELANEKLLIQHLDYTLERGEGVKTLMAFERSNGTKHMVVLKARKSSKGLIRKGYKDFQKTLEDPTRKTFDLSDHKPTALYYFETGKRCQVKDQSRKATNFLTAYHKTVGFPHIIHFL